MPCAQLEQLANAIYRQEPSSGAAPEPQLRGLVEQKLKLYAQMKELQEENHRIDRELAKSPSLQRSFGGVELPLACLLCW